MAVTLPFTFVNGTVIDAGQVNSNFSTLANVVPSTTTPLGVASGGTGANSLPLPTLPPQLNIGAALIGTSGSSLVPASGTTGMIGTVPGEGHILTWLAINNACFITPFRINGSVAAPTPVQSGNVLFGVGPSGWGASPTGTIDTTTEPASMYFSASENWSAAANGCELTLWLTTNGTPGTASHVALRARNNGDFEISGNTAYKPGSTTWTNPSDSRIKDEVGEYTRGLSDLLQLRPIRYRFNGRGGIARDGRIYSGLAAEEARNVLPEVVGTWKVKLDPIHQEEEILTVDSSDLIYLLINSVRELSAKVNTMQEHIDATQSD